MADVVGRLGLGVDGFLKELGADLTVREPAHRPVAGRQGPWWQTGLTAGLDEVPGLPELRGVKSDLDPGIKQGVGVECLDVDPGFCLDRGVRVIEAVPNHVFRAIRTPDDVFCDVVTPVTVLGVVAVVETSKELWG